MTNQHILSTTSCIFYGMHSVTHILTTHPLTLPSQHILSPYLLNTSSHLTFSTHSINTPSQHKSQYAPGPNGTNDGTLSPYLLYTAY